MISVLLVRMRRFSSSTSIFFLSVCVAVAKCQLDSDAEVIESAEEVSDLSIIGEDAQNYFGDGSFSRAAGVDTFSY